MSNPKEIESPNAVAKLIADHVKKMRSLNRAHDKKRKVLDKADIHSHYRYQLYFDKVIRLNEEFEEKYELVRQDSFVRLLAISLNVPKLIKEWRQLV